MMNFGNNNSNGGMTPAPTKAAIVPQKEAVMMVTAKTAALAATAILGTVGMAWAVPTVSDVSMAQLSGTRQVQVAYTLTGEDAIVTLSIETNGVAIPDSAVTRLTGDVNKVVAAGEGSKSILWNAGADWPENVTDTAKARVTAWCIDAPPQFMVVDLTDGSSENADYPVLYYTSEAVLPYGGLTNAIYKSLRLVMSKVTQGAFNMGETGTYEVILTNDFYTGVFQVTQRQWNQVVGSWPPAKFTDIPLRAYRPAENVSYNDIRGKTNDNPAVNWPLTDRTVVTEGSFLGKLRKRAKINGFDLPTEAQWEYACRAGTITYYNDGLETPGNTTSNAQMDVLGRYKYNGTTTAIVGSYTPNAWGLYDMHGNVNEWCLDWAGGNLVSGTDPSGPSSGTTRSARGGAWDSYGADSSRSAFRSSGVPTMRWQSFGFRLVITLP